MECFIEVFGIERIEALTGDREFIGVKWLTWLNEHNIQYVIRLKENGQYISNSRGLMVKANDLFRSLPTGEQVRLTQRKVGKKGNKLDVIGSRNNKGELAVFIHSAGVNDPVGIYTQRWQIETMFKAFKSSGFDCESTHITDDLRLDTLMQVMSVAFCLAYQVGEIIALSQPPIIKKHGYKQKSIFRIGRDEIMMILQNIMIQLDRWVNLILQVFATNLIEVKNKIVM
jgi:hypothetical protein